MTLNRVVLPAPLGPISPVICRGRAVRVTSVSALTPPNRTATSATRRTASASAGSSAGRTSVAGVDKTRLLLEEDRGRTGGLRRRGRPPGGLPRADPFGDLRDATADAVGVAADADRGETGQQVLQVGDLGDVVVQHREQREHERADE